MKYFALIFVILLLSACGQTADQIRTQAMSNGAMFAQASDLKLIDCSGIDSDGNNYVTCSFKDKVKQTVVKAECSYNPGGGCKYK